MRITVAIPAYNRPEQTVRAVRSALAQDVPGMEVLAIDDRSPEPTFSALQAIRDDRFRVIQNDVNLGLFGNFNRCLELAQGEWVRILCCDDMLTPNTLASELAIVEQCPTLALLSTRGRLVDPTGTAVGRVGTGFPPGIYRSPGCIVSAIALHAATGFNAFNYPSGMLIRRSAAGRFREDMHVAGDVSFFLNVLERGDLAVLDTVGCDVGFHPGQVSQKSIVGAYEMRELRAITDHYANALEQAGRLAEVRRNWAGLTLGLALQYRLRGTREAVGSHAALRQTMGVSFVRSAWALAKIILRRRFQKRLVMPDAPLPDHLR